MTASTTKGVSRRGQITIGSQLRSSDCRDRRPISTNAVSTDEDTFSEKIVFYRSSPALLTGRMRLANSRSWRKKFPAPRVLASPEYPPFEELEAYQAPATRAGNRPCAEVCQSSPFLAFLARVA